jgi:hypothetical protein
LATTKLPAYVNIRRLAGGVRAFYWVRPSWAKPPAARGGRTCPYETTPLGTDESIARVKADAINDGFKQWRLGVEAGPVKGSVKWLFIWYREQKRFTALRHSTRVAYRKMMDDVCDVELKKGTFGESKAGAVDGSAADKLYEKCKPKGERQAAYMMSTCRAVWGWAARHSSVTGVKDNPFRGMKIRTKAAKGNKPATRAQYNLYRETARAMNKQSMATAAALAFETCQRVWDCFGFVDPDGLIERGIRWGGYFPRDEISLVQSKTNNAVEIPLVDQIFGETVALYPELEEELARTPRHDGTVIVKDERTGEVYTVDYMQKLHRRIRIKAGLPDWLTFTSFRHGGLTEIGDSGETDVRSISGHSKLDTTAIYNKASQEKARSIAANRREHIAAKRREHIAMITAGENSAEEEG